jgi:hypothetical protein
MAQAHFARFPVLSRRLHPPPTARGGHYVIEPGNQVSIAAVPDHDSNAAQRAHLPNSATFDISALPAQRRCVALATTAGPQATEITQA